VTVIDWPFLPEIKTPADPDDWPWPLVRLSTLVPGWRLEHKFPEAKNRVFPRRVC